MGDPTVYALPERDRRPSTDERFKSELKVLCPDVQKLHAIYWEMKAELAEDLGYYLGRLKQLEVENEKLRAQLNTFVSKSSSKEKP